MALADDGKMDSSLLVGHLTAMHVWQDSDMVCFNL